MDKDFERALNEALSKKDDKDLIDALRNFVMSARKLNQEWEGNDMDGELADGYPFKKDFNEVARDIVDWAKAIDRKIK